MGPLPPWLRPPASPARMRVARAAVRAAQVRTFALSDPSDCSESEFGTDSEFSYDSDIISAHGDVPAGLGESQGGAGEDCVPWSDLAKMYSFEPSLVASLVGTVSLAELAERIEEVLQAAEIRRCGEAAALEKGTAEKVQSRWAAEGGVLARRWRRRRSSISEATPPCTRAATGVSLVACDTIDATAGGCCRLDGALTSEWERLD
mmetsp:Transcript_58462/g.161776  ORF Transcript_58462/g.161776 Transcript_58462/m.161776 type:complete len:205 (+) Transcript_58462:33-647(+)